MGLEGEERAEEDVGHPQFVDVAVTMATERLGLGATMPAALVDDADQAFLRFGPAAYWQSWPRGHAGSAVWTLCESSTTANSARWVPQSLPQGMYQVEAFVAPHADDLPKPFTRSARYRIKHAGVESSVEIGQDSTGVAWLDLGSYYFDGSEEYVELADATGEPSGSTVVMFDAVRWLPVETAETVFAAAAGDLAFDVVLPGEEARIVFQVRNTGTIPWAGSNIMLIGGAENPTGVPTALGLSGEIAPGSVASWNIAFTVAGVPGIRSVRYRMQHAGEPFGDVITGYVIVLPEALRDLEAEIRDQIDEWMQQGGQAVEDLMQAILLRIQEELEQQATNFLENLLSGCPGSGTLLSLVTIVTVRRRFRVRR
jgi:hypothetical protein